MNKKKKYIQNTIAYIVLLLMCLMALFPVFFTVSASFRTQEEMFGHMYPFTLRSLVPQVFTVENWVDIFVSRHFLRPIINTVIVTVSTIILGCLLNAIAAFAFTYFEFKGKAILYSLVLVSFMVPFEAIAIPLYDVASKLHLLDTYAGMVIPAIADGLVAMLFVQFFKDVPVALLEAARVDGASWMTILWKVVFPVSVPVFVSAGLMIFMSQWNAYMWPLLVARGEEIRTIQLAVASFAGEFRTKWTLIYTGAFISAIIPMLLFMPFQKYFVEGITAGSVKG